MNSSDFLIYSSVTRELDIYKKILPLMYLFYFWCEKTTIKITLKVCLMHIYTNNIPFFLICSLSIWYSFNKNNFLNN